MFYSLDEPGSGSTMINPALDNFPKEAALIGAMVVGYGELDITMVSCAGNAMAMTLPLLDALDQVNSEYTRIEIIRRLATPAFDTLGLATQFNRALAAQNECREVRNTFAHCHYGYDYKSGLMYVKARDLFAQNRKPPDLPWRDLTVEGLELQEAYFEATRKLWLWLDVSLPYIRKKQPSAFDEPPMPSIPPRDAGASTYYTNRAMAEAEAVKA
jgi:hypothetical protein